MTRPVSFSFSSKSNIVLNKIQRRFRNIFVTGLLITLPVFITIFILKFLYKHLDGLSPLFTELLIKAGVPIPEGYRIPFLGVTMTLIIIVLVGVFTTNIFGKRLVHLGETLVEKIPFVRRIYGGTKQVISSFVHADTTAFNQVVLDDLPKARAAIELILRAPKISSELVDNLNASIHLRTVLTDLFILSESLETPS